MFDHTSDIVVALDLGLLRVQGVQATMREEVGATAAAAQNLERRINLAEAEENVGVEAEVGAEARPETTEGGTGAVNEMIQDITALARVIWEEWFPTTVLHGSIARPSDTRSCLDRRSRFILRL
uniref:Replication protein E1 n=1 Tax=Lygus hesperus TaxID=30085 RepID=A0A0A9YJZ2_LYGHE